MIINIRGTGGAGKSHLVRSIMALYDSKEPSFQAGRKQPISYLLRRSDQENRLFVPGHYETPTGGCDTISKPDDVYDLVTDAAVKGYDILYEGIMIGDDVTRCIELNRYKKVVVIELSTPIKECLAGIQERRDKRGDDRPLNPKNTENRARRLTTSMMPRLRAAGVQTYKLSREEAFDKVKELLCLNQG